jgi:uncharacterized protein (TIGR02145 family)
MKRIFFLMLTLLIWSATSMNAQVRIGGTEDPHQSAVLDLNENDDANEGNFGLALPRVFLREKGQKLNNVTPADGTLIYNTNVDFARGRGIYFWTDSIWLRAASTYALWPGDTVAVLQKPEVKIISSPEEGLSASFGLDNYLDDGSAFRYDWTVIADGSPEYNLVPEYSSTKREVVTVPYDNVARHYTVKVKAIADGYNDSPVSDEVTTENTGTLRSSYDLLGESYYDIASTDYAPNYSYGIMDYRTPFALQANKDYTYKIVGKGGESPAFEWSVIEGADYLAGTPVSEDSIFKIRFADLSDNATIKSNPEAKLTVKLQCHVEDGDFIHDYVKTIEIGDRDACIPTVGLTDAEGNKYSVYRFGNSGCWMTQNLRSTKTLQNGIEMVVAENKNVGNSNTLAAWYYPNGDDGRELGYGKTTNLEYGLLYTWAAANIGTVANEAADAFKISANEGTNSNRQGICPAGWVVPSDWDWAMLEKEIASYPEYYSTKIMPYDNLDNSTFYGANSLDWRPTSSRTDTDDNTYWGAKMKSPTIVGSITNTYGFSDIDGTGFNALLIGSLNGGLSTDYSTYAIFWSSSSGNSTVAWRRLLNSYYSGVTRNTINKYRPLSVRCKKNDN